MSMLRVDSKKKIEDDAKRTEAFDKPKFGNPTKQRTYVCTSSE